MTYQATLIKGKKFVSVTKTEKELMDSTLNLFRKIPVDFSFFEKEYPEEFSPVWTVQNEFSFAEKIGVIKSNLRQCNPMVGLVINSNGYLVPIAGFASISSILGYSEEEVKAGSGKNSRRFYFVGSEVIYQPNPNIPYLWRRLDLRFPSMDNWPPVDEAHLDQIIKKLNIKM